MKKLSNLIICCFTITALILQVSCKMYPPTDLTKENIIPKPVLVTANGETFSLCQNSGIYIQGASGQLDGIANYLAELFRPATGFDLAIKTTEKSPPKGSILLSLSGADASLGDEGYVIEITKKLVKISANTTAGIFNGIQTFRQLLPAEIEMKSKQNVEWLAAGGVITDYPVFSYRGTMLDVTRHFIPIEGVKRHIDLISAYKINHLHLHLSDDQGWRIEIKSWPNLTEYGSQTQVGGGEGGFFTQEQYKDIVKYAAEHNVTIVPEIDMPGHTNAALASYPELNADGKAPELYTGVEVGFSTFAARKEITYKFIEDVLREIAEMTPGPYLHIGGDESHVTKKDDYIYFVERVQDIVLKLGKVSIGWDEISQTVLRPGTIAQFWSRRPTNAINAVAQGAKLLMSPSSRAYIDMKYDADTRIGYTWAGLLEVDRAYDWDPGTFIEGVGIDNIIGVEAPLWTETILNIKDVEYLAFPRLPGIAEIGWTAAENRNWDEYKVRLGNHAKRFKAMDINYYPSKVVPWVE
jgi:hexosaminidase